MSDLERTMSTESELERLVDELPARIGAAIDRIACGQAAMRIPVDKTDPDIVLADCGKVIAALRSRAESAPLSARERTERLRFVVEMRTQRDECADALRNLVMCVEYEHRQEPVWKVARAALKSVPTYEERLRRIFAESAPSQAGQAAVTAPSQEGHAAGPAAGADQVSYHIAKVTRQERPPLIIPTEAPKGEHRSGPTPYPTIEGLADLKSGDTFGYQGPVLVAEAVRCWRELREAQAELDTLKKWSASHLGCDGWKARAESAEARLAEFEAKAREAVIKVGSGK